MTQRKYDVGLQPSMADVSGRIFRPLRLWMVRDGPNVMSTSRYVDGMWNFRADLSVIYTILLPAIKFLRGLISLSRSQAEWVKKHAGYYHK